MWTQLAPCLIDGHHAAAIVKGVTSASAVPAAAFVVKTGVRDDYHRYRSRSRGRHVSSIRPPEQRVQRTSPSGSWRAVDRQGCWENPYSQRIAMAGNAGKSSRRRRRLFNAVGNLRAGSAGVGSSVGPRDSDLDETAPVEVHRPPSIRDEMLQILRPDIPKILVSMFLAVVGTAAALVGPLNYARVVSVILDPSPSASRLLRAVAILGVGYIVEPTMTYFYVRSMSRVVDRAAARLKARAFRALLSREVAFFDLMGSAELSAAVTTDVMVVKEAIQGNLQRDRGLRAVMETILGLLVLVVLSPRLAWIFGMVIPLTAWGLAESRKKLAQLGEEEGKSLAVEAAIASEAVRNIREVRGFGAEGREVARFEAASSRVGPVSARIGEASGRLEALNRAAIYFSIATVMFTGGRLVSLGLMSAPLLLSFVGFCFSLNFAMQGVNFTITDFKRGQAALQRVYQVIAPPGVVGKAARAGMDVISPRDFEGRVDFCKVHFTYPTRPDKPVFSGLDLTLSAGKVTALVGRSGGGKSTIAALLSRFYAPSRGDILIDGMDVTELDRKWLTQKMALVGQNPALFTGTIAENIAYGVPNEVDSISMDKIVEAAELANARDFIEEFPQGFSTFIGEGGVQLSGGQRQRIAIARALLKDARILILDEATSALDAQSEALVQEALSRLMAGRTVLVIAHRLSTVVSADKICVLHQGKVIEEGKHDELLERKGSYANLMTTQVIEEGKHDELLERKGS